MTPSANSTPVAVIGMSCRLPGGSNPAEFWQMVRQGEHAIGPLADDRLNRDLHYHPEKGHPGKTYTDLGAVISYDDVWEMKRRFPVLVDCEEPTFLLLCAVAVEAWANAGLSLKSASDWPNTGVYLGHTRNSGLTADKTFHALAPEMARLLCQSPEFRQANSRSPERVAEEILTACRSPYQASADRETSPTMAHQAAWQVARCLGLNGPTMSFNSACASSMHALLQGARAVQQGAIDMAIVGGATYLHPETLRVFSQAQSVSANGSRPMDAHADGLVVGEGCVLFLLKRLDQALADGNPIQAVLGGMGISSDGKGKSLWAPRAEGQIEAIQRAYRDGISLDSIGYLEAHATSTQVGDATEINALAKTWSQQLDKGAKIPLGSVKANIGHTLETAGAAGLLKMILAMQHGEIPPVASLQTLNDKIDWENAPFYAPTKVEAWPEPTNGQPRRGAVSSFGIGGLNVHLVIEQFSESYHRSPAIRVRSRTTEQPEPIAIIGRGCILPGAGNVAQLVELMQSGIDPKQNVPADRWSEELYPDRGNVSPNSVRNSLGGYVTDFEYDWRRHRVPPKQIATANPLQFMILDSVEQALAEAGYEERDFHRERTGVIVGALFGGDFSHQLQLGLRLPEFQQRIREVLTVERVAQSEIDTVCASYTKWFLENMPALTDETGSFSSSSLASRITKTFNLMGGAAAVEAGMSSSLAALQCCCHQLAAGDTDMMICVGGQRDMSPVKYQGWSQLKMLSKEQTLSPLDAAADGCVPGEGSVVLLLKRLADARRDNDPVFGIIDSIGAASTSDTESLEETVCAATLRALEQDNVCSEAIQLVEVSSTGRPLLDDQIFAGLSEALAGFRRCRKASFGSSVAQIGHLSGASGLVSLLRATAELEHLKKYPNFGLTRPRRLFSQSPQPFSALPAAEELRPTDSEGRCFASIHSGGVRDVHYNVVLQRGAPVEMKTTIVHFDATTRRKARLRSQGAPTPQQVTLPVSPPPATGSLTPANNPLLSKEELANFLVNFVVEQTGYPPEMVELDADLEADLGIDSIKKAQLFGELREYFDIEIDDQLSLDDFPTLEQVLSFLHQGNTLTQSSTLTATEPAPLTARRNGFASLLNGHALQPLATSPAATTLGREELADFLVNFVVEQTGYPPEMVELNADLEADLGIDSIKKAQLFGELREYFDIEINDQLSLDDFPTLEEVLVFLQQGNSTASPANPSAITPVPLTKEIDSDVSLYGHSKQPFLAKPTVEPLSKNELADFLVNFVVEQTGYPPEMVELNADLEADLGIDSIKKAQLFGELREYFDIEINDQLSLDDFLTLEQVLHFLAENAQRL